MPKYHLSTEYFFQMDNSRFNTYIEGELTVYNKLLLQMNFETW